MPAMAVESGPAAGVVAAALVARQTGRPNLLSFDMGGTTAKASLIRNGQYETTPEYEVGGGASGNRWMHGTGHPIRVPVIDLAEVSAGGGSIAWVDRAGALRVGPKSAGADPGPGVLRPRRHRADRHRLQPAARLSRQGLAARRRPAHRSRGGRSRRRQAPRRAAGRRCAHGGGRRHRRRQSRHGGSAQDRLRAARPRSARVRAGGLRRGGPAACRRARRRARHRRGALPADPRRVLGARPRRHAISSATTCAPSTPPRRPPIPRRWRPPSPRSRRRAAPCSTAPAWRRSGGASSAPSMRATSANPTSSPIPVPVARARCRRAGGDRRGLPRSPPRHLRPRQPQRAGAARQRAPRRRSARSRRCWSATGPAPAGTDAVKSQPPACGSAKPARSTPPSTIARRMPAGLVVPGRP